MGVVSGAGRKGELYFAPAEERTHVHTHTHGHMELRVRVTPKMYTHVHYSHTSLTCSTTQIWPSSPPFFPLCCAQSLQSCLTLFDPMDCSPPGSSVHRIFLTRILEWVANPPPGESSLPRDQTCAFFTAPGKSVFLPPACHKLSHRCQQAEIGGQAVSPS